MRSGDGCLVEMMSGEVNSLTIPSGINRECEEERLGGESLRRSLSITSLSFLLIPRRAEIETSAAWTWPGWSLGLWMAMMVSVARSRIGVDLDCRRRLLVYHQLSTIVYILGRCGD